MAKAGPPTRLGGELVFVSGQLAIDDDGQLVGAGRWDLQAEQVLRRIERELGEHGVQMEDVVRLTSYLVDAGGYPGLRQGPK